MPFLYLALIGIIAGILDTAPMVLRKMNPYSIASAFVFHLTAPALCYFISIPLAPWLKGAALYLVLALPILILIAKEEKKAVPIVAANTLIIGALVGWVLSFI